MQSLKNYLAEAAKLSRVLNHIRSGPFAIITAHRGENSTPENRTRQLDLAAKIRMTDHGFLKLEGHWIENQNTPDELDVIEDSLFVIGHPDEDADEFGEAMHQLGNTFDQEAIVFGDGSDVFLLFSDGGKTRIGTASTIQTTALGQAFSKIRGKPFAFTECFVVEALVDYADDGKVVLTHYSDTDKLTKLDPKHHGKGLDKTTRSARNLASTPGFLPRMYFGAGVGKPGGYKKETGLGKHEYRATADLSQIYNINADNLDLKTKATQEVGRNDPMLWFVTLENLIKSSGYKLYSHEHPSLGQTVISFVPLKVDAQIT